MKPAIQDHELEFLLAFDGRVHYLAKDYWLKFEIREVEATAVRPHGISYSFTLHAPDGQRLVGFDNAHAVAFKKGWLGRRSTTYDHWHRATKDPGQPYAFKDVGTLIGDFFDEVERVLAERGIDTTVLDVEEGGK
jgi:hypothetical protein